MSSHYIYVSCSTEGCDAFDSIYTGNESLDNFNDNTWEGETISVPCKIHEAHK